MRHISKIALGAGPDPPIREKHPAVVSSGFRPEPRSGPDLTTGGVSRDDLAVFIHIMKIVTPLLASLLLFGHSVYADNPKQEADNTGQNVRDQSGATKTPFDQSEKAEDVELTAQIRRQVMADDSLSTLAKNVKIITSDGRVALRGPVNTAAEKAKIVQIAKNTAGVKTTLDEIEVK